MPSIEITTKIGCKNACAYCPQKMLIRAYRMRSNTLEMSLDVFKQCLDKIPTNVHVYFAGMCEPWLNSECTNMVLYAYKKGYKIHVNTTLVNMNLSDVDLLKTCSYEEFSVHLPSENGQENIMVDDKYLGVLETISKSDIKAVYKTHTEAAPLSIRLKLGNDIPNMPLLTRAGNLKNANIPLPNRKRGGIRCARSMDWPVLLPNGDVILCCMDYGLKHVLGNLISTDHDSLFHSPEYLRVKKGLKDESLDILCRYCETYAGDADFAAKFHNFYLPRVKYRIKNVKNLGDIFQLIRRCTSLLFGLIRNRY
jgi:hypothetical protein